MKRQIIVDAVAAILSIATVGLMFGLWWLVSLLVNANIPHLVHSRTQANVTALTIMMIVIAFLAAWLTSVFPMKNQARLPKARHTHPHPHLHLHFRH